MQFNFATSPDIRFGRGTAKGTAEAAAAISDRALVVHGRSASRAAWLLDDLVSRGVTVEAVACHGEPDLDTVDHAIALARKIRPGVVLALGGGSCIDLGKAVAALVPAIGPTLAYLEGVGEGQNLDARPLPFIAIPTTAGTGAEVTKNAVIQVPEAQKKVSLRDPRMIPDIAIVDPALTDNAPAKVTFCSGFDAITQVIEPYLSVNASAVTDALCADAIPRGLNAIVRLAEGEDAKARDDMALTSLFGGMALANAGLGAVHGLAGVIGGKIGAPHGEVCATLLAPVLTYNAEAVAQESSAAVKSEKVLRWIADAFGVSPVDAISALRDTVTSLGIRGLKEMGVSPEDVHSIATAARSASSSKTNPVPPQDVDFGAILERAGVR